MTGFRLPLLLGLLCVLTPAVSDGLRATVGLEYDNNPFETRRENRRSGWINRFFLFSSARLKQSNRHVIQVRHQWGLKRLWKSEMANGAHGDVVASQLDFGGIVQLNDRYTASWGTDVKIKNVQRVSSEESYLRGNLRLGLVARLDDRFTAALKYRRGEDDARDSTLVDLSVSELGGEVTYSPGRNFMARLIADWRHLDYDRPALQFIASDDAVVRDQSDRSCELKAELQLYRGGLANVSYALLDNESNSAGFGYRAYRLQLLYVRHLTRGVDGQLFVMLQRRRYDEEIPSLSLAGIKEDEYHQTLWSFKLARRLNEVYGLSGQYRRARNGSRRGEGAFQKNIYSLILDVSI